MSSDQLSENFKRSEFACHCGCGFDDVHPELVIALQDVRDTFNSPVQINSGCRCITHNAKVGGSIGSQHLLGKAADIVVKYALPHEVAHYLEDKYPDRYGIGRYNTFTHIDVRPKKARWDQRE